MELITVQLAREELELPPVPLAAEICLVPSAKIIPSVDTLPLTPTPPLTTKAPVVLLVDDIVFETYNCDAPLTVINEPVFAKALLAVL